MARCTKFVQRSSILDGFTFLCLLVFNSDSLAYESLNDLTVKLELEYGISMSKQGLDERFSEHAVQFLKVAISELLSKQLTSSVLMKCDQFNRILIKDSVCFQIDESLADFFPGSGGSGSGAAVRIQFEYDLLSGTVVDLSLSAFNDQDAVNSRMTLDVVNEGDLIIRDLAYMHIDALQGILDRLGHFLSRLQANRNVYQWRNDKVMVLNFRNIAKSMERSGINRTEAKVFLDKEMTFEVRLLIYLVPLEVYQRRIRKAGQKNRSKGRQLSKEFKARARLNLFITSVPVDLLDLDSAWKAYTLRWQIELGFKVWKSLWKIDKVKKVKKERLECYIWAKLFVIMLCHHSLWIVQAMLRSTTGKSLSFYKASKTLIYLLHDLKRAILSGTEAMVKFLAEFLELSSRKHLLEKRREGNYSPEILSSSYIIRYNGEIVSLSC